MAGVTVLPRNRNPKPLEQMAPMLADDDHGPHVAWAEIEKHMEQAFAAGRSRRAYAVEQIKRGLPGATL